MMLVPGMAIGAITNFQAMSMPERFPEEWANSGLKCSPTLYRILMVIHHHFADDQLLLADFADSALGNRYCYCHHTDLCMDLVPHEEGLCQYYKYN